MLRDTSQPQMQSSRNIPMTGGSLFNRVYKLEVLGQPGDRTGPWTKV